MWSVTEGASCRKENIDDKEWDGVPQFLRRLYDAGDDMLFLSKSMDASKKETAKTLAADFKSQVKGVDRPAQAKDRDAVLKTYASTSGEPPRILPRAWPVVASRNRPPRRSHQVIHRAHLRHPGRALDGPERDSFLRSNCEAASGSMSWDSPGQPARALNGFPVS